MAHKQISRQEERRGSLMETGSEAMRGLVERMERFFEKPWDFMSGAFEPKLDLEQTPKELIVSTRLPGYAREDVSIDLTEDSITIRGSKSSSKESRKHGAARYEREERSFARSMSLPAFVRTDEAKASFKGDKLEIRLPRVKEASVRRLDVE